MNTELKVSRFNMKYLFGISLAVAVPLISAGFKPKFSMEDKAKYPYLDPDLPMEQRLDDLVARTSVDQMARTLSDYVPAIDEGDVQIPGFDRGEALHGLGAPKHYPVTIWPSPICMGSTWGKDLIRETADRIGIEARARYHGGHMIRNDQTGPLILYTPGVYLARDPRWGRYQECYGEDPFLVSRMTVNYVKGMQGDHPRYLKAACTTKCFAAYNKEFMRFCNNSEISERWLREYYFKAHKACFQEAQCRATMTSYSAINGVPCSVNKWLLTDVLKNEWGFTGFVMEDASATMSVAKEDKRDTGNHGYCDTFEEAGALALNAGMDFMLCNIWERTLESAIAKGLTTEEKIKEAFRRVMRVRMECGEFDPEEMSPWANLTLDVLANPEHTAHARMMARKGIILLKNNPTGKGKKVLPISRGDIKSIAVVGPNTESPTLGIYSGNPKYQWNILQGLQEASGDGVDVVHVPWKSARAEELIHGRSSTSHVGLDGVGGWKVEFFNNPECAGDPCYSDVVDFPSYMHEEKRPEGLTTDNFSIRWSADINPPKAGPYTLNAFSDDSVKLVVDGKTLIDYPKAHWRSPHYADVEFRSDRSYNIVYEYRNIGNPAVNTGLFWEPPQSASSVEYGELEAARRCDVVVAVLGLHRHDEGEGGADRQFANVKNDQIELLKGLVEVNPNVVVVLINGSPLTLETVADIAPAIVEAWYPGQAGIAVADLLFGDANFSGHLPVTFYKEWERLGTIDEFHLDRGRRTYMYAEDDNVLYPFGHGLSYSDFEFSDLTLFGALLTGDGELQAQLKVKNTGDRMGSDVVQLYAREARPVKGRPKRQLVAFMRVEDLQPGEERTVRLGVKAKDLEYWDAKRKQMRVASGNYVLELGESSAEIVDRVGFVVQ